MSGLLIPVGCRCGEPMIPVGPGDLLACPYCDLNRPRLRTNGLTP